MTVIADGELIGAQMQMLAVVF